MKKIYIIDGVHYLCKVNSCCNLVEVTMYEEKATFPFAKRIGYKNFEIDAFASIDLGVVHCLKKQIAKLERENRNYKKWKDFEKSLDKPYEV